MTATFGSILQSIVERRSVLAGGFAATAIWLSGCSTIARQQPKDKRLITFSLWAGVEGAAFGDSVDITVESRTIRGPFDWKHPVTHRSLPVYERLNREPRGEKRQYFTLNADGSALARVYDTRPGQADRYFVGDAFFPLGRWAESERRTYRMTTYQDGRSRDYDARIWIGRLSHEYRGVPGSLRYDWRLTDLDGNVIFDERYDYSPGVGFVRFSNRKA